MALRFFQAMFWLLLLLQFITTHAPLSTALHPFMINDKLLHLVGYFVLAVVLRLAWPGLSWLVVIALAALYGAFDELSQGLVPGRFPDVCDWLADTLGAGLGIVVVSLTRRHAPHRLEKLICKQNCK